ncbi:hypothetical protein [Terribacillus sp. AE2B 122]|jgi:hypothetical protein|uniref:hypothetical protein n=1 Tax=Terribacillus sp. AE2B 122 TaxID=1331902 RepID=UPI001583427C|nr:hypothetical protein [Terribacillus sp. AE2B 122]
MKTKRCYYGKLNYTEYKLTKDMDGNLKILTQDKSKIDDTFVDKYQSGVYTKVVEPNELKDCVKIQVYGDIQGKKVEVLKERNDKYQVSTGSLLIGEELKLPRIDRDTWLGWVPKSEVKLILEETPFDPKRF